MTSSSPSLLTSWPLDGSHTHPVVCARMTLLSFQKLTLLFINNAAGNIQRINYKNTHKIIQQQAGGRSRSELFSWLLVSRTCLWIRLCIFSIKYETNISNNKCVKAQVIAKWTAGGLKRERERKKEALQMNPLFHYLACSKVTVAEIPMGPWA